MNEENNEIQTLEGTIVFQKNNIGTKSESVQPFLYVNQNQVIHLFMQNSNPFENNQLKEFDGKSVFVKGKIHNGTFVVESIENVKDF